MSAEASDKKTVFGLPYNVGVGLLCVLGVVCLYEFYSNVLAGPGVPDTPRSPAASAVAAAPAIPMPGSLPGAEGTRRVAATQRRNEEFNPPLHSKRPEDRIDPIKFDPTLQLDRLAKVQSVDLAVGARNLFQMGAAPKPELLASAGPIWKPIGPVRPPEPVKPQPPPQAPVLPIALKFYGFSTIRSNGRKTAYFMDGEDIMLAGEGELLKRRYRVVRILATSVLMEDTDSKRTESLPLTPEAQS